MAEDIPRNEFMDFLERQLFRHRQCFPYISIPVKTLLVGLDMDATWLPSVGDKYDLAELTAPIIRDLLMGTELDSDHRQVLTPDILLKATNQAMKTLFRKDTTTIHPDFPKSGEEEQANFSENQAHTSAEQNLRSVPSPASDEDNSFDSRISELVTQTIAMIEQDLIK